MKLKKLEINGFKSFHEKATIQFPPGISAVVGPNGCGKSNIIDALRWVMGEQSVKQLRGKAMEDVIFAGSNGKPPLNMAEVSLVIENDNGSVPGEFRDYAEIMCTRRLYRSGESAYFLNKRPCRLKDIHNLFLGSGLGSKSYAMIQQGNIGAITDAGPDERRFFIEEAAGVTRFKRRKDEALRKVESTHQNLLRLNDITSEIKRQMSSLKRQARKAELYQKYQKQIRQLDILISVQKNDNLKQKIDETGILLKGLQDTDVEHTSKLKQIDAAVEEIKLKRWQKDQIISDLKSRIYETQRRLDRAENDLSHYRQDVERLEGEIKKLTSSHRELEGKNHEISTEIDTVEKQITVLKADEDRVNAKLDQEKAATEEIQGKLSVLNQELDGHKSELMDLVAQEARYKNIFQNVSNNKESLKRRLKRLDEEVLQSEKHEHDCQEILKEAQAHLTAFKDKISAISDHIKTLQTRLEEKKQVLAKQVKQVQTLELERNKTKSQYTALKKMADNFEWFKDGVKAIMQKKPSETIVEDSELERLRKDGLVCIMADTIEPKPSYEIPVEAVLGESLQHILVKDQETGAGFIHYLQSHLAGRSGFIPVSGIKPLEDSRQKQPDPSNLLLNHISVKPGFEKIAQALLGHVVLVEDLEEAQKVYNKNGALQTVVTKEGDIISHQGILIGGSKGKISGILEKKQELKQLEKEMADFEGAISKARLDQQQLESDLRDSETRLQQQIEKRNDMFNERTEAEKDVYKATEDLKHAKRRHDIVCLEQEQLLGEENELDEELSRYEIAVAEIAVAVREAQEKVTALSEKIGGFSLDMDRYNQTIVNLKLELTALNARIENSNSHIKRLVAFRDDGVSRLREISRDIEQKKQQQATSAGKIDDYSATLISMYDEFKHLEQELESHQENYHVIDTELKHNDSRISEIQTQREALSQKIRVLEIEQSERHIQRNNIATRLFEQYQCPIEDLRAETDSLSEDPSKPISEMEEDLNTLRAKIFRINDVNLAAIKEYDQLQERFAFLSEQRDDLVTALDDLHKVIKKINRISQERFIKTLTEVNEKLNEVFPRLFEGGSAQLILTEPDKPLESGLSFMVHPPGKKLTRMSLLSGGEKALSAIAFIFSIFLIKPASFCLMDEIDAPLDDVNIYRFNNLLQIIGEKSQIIMITHNKKTMEFADRLFGITMVNKGISKVVSVNLSSPDSTPDTAPVQAVSA